MNERIKKLWDQSKTSGVHPEFGEYVMYSAEKFAELIIRECSQIVCSTGEHDYIASAEILEHFGVESKPIIPIEIEPHTCPYKIELYGDETLCTCSPEQEHECAMDV